jgi:hypothetical protein
MNQMQMLMYYAQLGMLAQMNNGGGGMGMPGVPPAGPLPNMPNMANPMMFPMMNPQQMAAFCASAQQQWQAGMPASAIANIAAAAAVAATAATNQDVSGTTACHARVTRCCVCCKPFCLLVSCCHALLLLSPHHVDLCCSLCAEERLAPLQLLISPCLCTVFLLLFALIMQEPGAGNRGSNRGPRGPMADLKQGDRRMRCHSSGGGRSSGGRMDDGMGSPSIGGRVDPLLEEYKNNRTRRWEMRVRGVLLLYYRLACLVCAAFCFLFYAVWCDVSGTTGQPQRSPRVSMSAFCAHVTRLSSCLAPYALARHLSLCRAPCWCCQDILDHITQQ